MSTIVSIVNDFLPNNQQHWHRWSCFILQFQYQLFLNLFGQDEYSTSITILSSIEDALSPHTTSEVEEKNVIIIVGDQNVRDDELKIGTSFFS